MMDALRLLGQEGSPHFWLRGGEKGDVDPDADGDCVTGYSGHCELGLNIPHRALERVVWSAALTAAGFPRRRFPSTHGRPFRALGWDPKMFDDGNPTLDPRVPNRDPYPG